MIELNVENVELKEFMKNKEKELNKPFDIISFIKTSKEFVIQDNKKSNNISDIQYKYNKEVIFAVFDYVLVLLKDFGITEKNGYLFTYLDDDNETR